MFPSLQNLLSAFAAAFRVPAPSSGFPSPMGATLVEVLRGQMGLGEAGGNNAGPHVARWKGLPLHTRGDLGAWCASLVSWGLEQAGFVPELHGIPRAGVDGWARRRHGARWLFSTMARVGQQIDAPEVGALVLWPRGPIKSWKAHIGVVSMVTPLGFRVIEGNHGLTPAVVAEFEHTTNEPRKAQFCRLGRP